MAIIRKLNFGSLAHTHTHSIVIWMKISKYLAETDIGMPVWYLIFENFHLSQLRIGRCAIRELQSRKSNGVATRREKEREIEWKIKDKRWNRGNWKYTANCMDRLMCNISSIVCIWKSRFLRTAFQFNCNHIRFSIIRLRHHFVRVGIVVYVGKSTTRPDSNSREFNWFLNSCRGREWDGCEDRNRNRNRNLYYICVCVVCTEFKWKTKHGKRSNIKRGNKAAYMSSYTQNT